MSVVDDFLARARPFVAAGVLADSDVHAVALTAPRFGEDDVERMLGLAFAARAPRVSHPGIDLTRVRDTLDAELRFAADVGVGVDPVDADAGALPWPADAAAWAATTATSPMVGAPDDAGRPFVLQPRPGRTPLLLTRRMYVEQQRVAAALAARAPLPVPPTMAIPALEETLARLFGDDADGEAARAVRLAATRRLALVVGGPGTGKTFSVTRLLAALLQHADGDARRRGESIALAAPTGKAAARMREAIREATAPDAHPALAVDDDVRACLQALPATTLHRLVGVRPDGSVRHDAAHPIPARLVIVDEVSMVDLTMMRRLLEAVHPEARLVLLGDRDQLASVEAGCVLADLVPAGVAGALAGNTQTFTRSRRFASAPDIALIAACLQSYATQHEDVPPDDAAAARARALAVFCGEAHATAERRKGARVLHHGVPEDTPHGARPTDEQLQALAGPYCAGFDDLAVTTDDGAAARRPGYATLLRQGLVARARGATLLDDPLWQRRLLAAFDQYRVLAVHRRGPLGVQQLERELARRVRAFLRAGGGVEGAVVGDHWIGRPILVTENAWDTGLMNGDVGIVLVVQGRPAAIFAHEDPTRVRTVAVARLPPHEGALAMTVHKSQGSQFDRVALVLAGRESPIQTRELIYTGVTRARMQLAWLGRPDELRAALDRQVHRASGLPALIEASRATSDSP
jgi:exodeoxyribonuclease V alpha subunit